MVSYPWTRKSNVMTLIYVLVGVYLFSIYKQIFSKDFIRIIAKCWQQENEKLKSGNVHVKRDVWSYKKGYSYDEHILESLGVDPIN